MKKLGNVLTCVFHIVGLLFIAMMCYIRHVPYDGYSIIDPTYDIVLIVAAVLMIAIHYFVFEKQFAHKIRTWIFAGVECAIAFSFIWLFSIPNTIINVALYEGIIVLIVQLFIVSARVVAIVGSYRSNSAI